MSDKDDYEIARERIEREAEERTGTLDLSGLTIDELPREISTIPVLSVLKLESFNVQDWSTLSRLPSVDALDLSFSGICRLDVIDHFETLSQLNIRETNVTDISPLARLHSIRRLNMRNTLVLDLSPICLLDSLIRLDCGRLQSFAFNDFRFPSRLEHLNCDELRIYTSLPLSKAKQLRHLSFTNAPIREINCLAGCSELEYLDIRWSAVESLDPLEWSSNLTDLYCSSTKIKDIRALSNAKNLKNIEISSTVVTDLSPISGARQLESVSVEHTGVHDLSPLQLMQEISYFSCNNTPVSDLSFLKSSREIEYLWLCNTNVDNIDWLSNTKCVPRVYADGTSLETLCGNVTFNHLARLSLHNSALKGVPQEVLSHEPFEDCLPRLQDYFRDLNEQSAPIPDVKLIVIGNGQIGKTQIARKLCGDGYDDSVASTHGIFVRDTLLEMPSDEPQTLLNIWDFGGQELYHGTHALFLDSRAIFMVVWTPETETGEETQEDGFVFRNYPLRYWLDSVRQAASSDCPILLVQTQCDTPAADHPIPPVEADYLNSISSLKIVQYSAKENRNRDSLDSALRDAVRDLRGSEGISAMGSGRMQVKNQLQTWRTEDAPRKPQDRQHRTLTQDEFVSLCEETGNVSSPASLLDYLHHAGIVFYRVGLFDNQIILDQSWALDAIYTIFHRQQCVRQLQSNRGRFTRELLGLLAWQDYSEAEQKLFLSMMESCGICFKHEESYSYEDQETEYIAPDLLPTREDSNAALAGRWNHSADGYERCWTYDFLPPGLVRTLISRIGQAAGGYADYWKYGVWFYEATTDAKAILEQTAAGPYEGQIVLRTQGDNGELLGRIAEWVEECHTKFRQLSFNITGNTPEVRIKQQSENRDEISEAEPDPPLRFTDQPRLRGEKRYCVSYAWKEELHEDPERAGKVQEFCNEVNAAGFRLIRDTTDVRYWDDLKVFMRNVGSGDHVYVVLSDAYLKSENCMFELYTLWLQCRFDSSEFRARIRTYLTDTKLLEDDAHFRYVDYWKEKLALNEQRLKQYAFSYGEPKFARGRFVDGLVKELSTILEHIAQTLQPQSFDDYFQAAIEELKQEQQQENSDVE